MKFIGKVMIIPHLGTDLKVLVPGRGEHDQEQFSKLRVGSEYKVDARKARNPDHHRKGFALIKMIFDSQERYTTMEDLLVELKLRVGWYTEHIRANGELIYVPKSISFADMDQTEFEQFYDALVDIATSEYGLADALEFMSDRAPLDIGQWDGEDAWPKQQST